MTAIIRPSTRRSMLGHGRVGVGEDARFRSHRFETRTREERAVAVGQPRPLDGVHLGDVRDLIDAEQQRVEDGEEHRDHAEADRDGHDDRAVRPAARA